MFLPFAQLNETQIKGIFVTCLVIMGLVLAGYVVVMLIKRKLQGPDNSKPAAFSLEDIRRLHDAGQLTDEEFEKAKQVILAATQAHLASKPAGGPSQSDIDIAKARNRAKDR